MKKSDLTTAQGQIITLTANNTTLTSDVATLTTDKANLTANVATLNGQIATLNAEKTSLTNDKDNLTVQVNTLQGQRNALQAWKDSHVCSTPAPHECEKCKHSEYIVNELKLTEFNKDTELEVIVAKIKELLGKKPTTITVADEVELNKAKTLIEELSKNIPLEEIKRIDLILLEDCSDEIKQMYSQATTYSEVVVARNAYYEKKQSSKNEVVVVNEAGKDKVVTVNQVGKHEREL